MKNNQCWWILAGIAFVAAALLDIKYKGLGYRMLPESLKKKIDLED
ncbi:hypothetical protein [Thalassobacillus devorans]|nr:hypothetical protein [Thalassobacillus devorans]